MVRSAAHAHLYEHLFGGVVGTSWPCNQVIIKMETWGEEDLVSSIVMCHDCCNFGCKSDVCDQICGDGSRTDDCSPPYSWQRDVVLVQIVSPT